MSESSSANLRGVPTYEFYDSILTSAQKTLFQTKIAGNTEMLKNINSFCNNHGCAKEEIFDIACRIYNLAQKSGKDAHGLGEFQILPKIKQRFGDKEGTFLYDKIISNLLIYLTTTKSLHALPVVGNNATSEAIAELLQRKPPNIRKISAA